MARLWRDAWHRIMDVPSCRNCGVGTPLSTVVGNHRVYEASSIDAAGPLRLKLDLTRPTSRAYQDV